MNEIFIQNQTRIEGHLDKIRKLMVYKQKKSEKIVAQLETKMS